MASTLDELISDHLHELHTPVRRLAATVTDELATATGHRPTITVTWTPAPTRAALRWRAGPAKATMWAACQQLETFHRLNRLAELSICRTLHVVDRARIVIEAVIDRTGPDPDGWYTDDWWRWSTRRDLNQPTPVNVLAATLLLERHTELFTRATPGQWHTQTAAARTAIATEIRDLVDVATATVG